MAEAFRLRGSYAMSRPTVEALSRVCSGPASAPAAALPALGLQPRQKTALLALRRV